jgi:hypothetical protein
MITDIFNITGQPNMENVVIQLVENLVVDYKSNELLEARTEISKAQA